MRGTMSFAELYDYRCVIDEIVSRKNTRIAKHIDIERAVLQPLPGQRTCDYEETIVTVTSSSAFTLRKVFYTVTSRLIGQRLRVRLYDARLAVFIGVTLLMTDRKSGVWGQSVSVRVDLGGRRIIQKNK